MEKETKKVGRPARYNDAVVITHRIENNLLYSLNKLATFEKTRTDLINEAITKFLNNQ